MCTRNLMVLPGIEFLEMTKRHQLVTVYLLLVTKEFSIVSRQTLVHLDFVL